MATLCSFTHQTGATLPWLGKLRCTPCHGPLGRARFAQCLRFPRLHRGDGRRQQLPVLDGLTLKKQLEAGDAWFVFAPEYNGSYPPVLNNAIAWLSREGDDFRRLFQRPPCGPRHAFRRRWTARHHGHAHAILVPWMRRGWAVAGGEQEKPANPETIDAMLNAMTGGCIIMNRSIKSIVPPIPFSKVAASKYAVQLPWGA